MNNSYRQISQVGSNAYQPINNPLSYCIDNTLDQRFLHGGSSDTLGQHSKACQAYLSDYCAENWDDFCELGSSNRSINQYPNNIQGCESVGDTPCLGLSAGEILIHNTASKKYLVEMIGCEKKFEPFDPNVATSPMISYWVKGECAGERGCVPIYEVNPLTIDNDIVMNKILNKPIIALGILVNIYNSMKRRGNLVQLKGTRLGNFYSNNQYFVSLGGV